MTSAHGPLYEVTLSIDRDIVEEFDLWLEQHVRDMLELPGFVSASTFEVDTGSPGQAGRTVQYLMESEQALEAYLAGPAAEMRTRGALRFADRIAVTRRVLRPTGADEGDPRPPENCLNCGAPLQGQYCAHCGQRARGRLISIWELVRDAVGDLFELDSRLWRTIMPLMFHPGQLTHDYLIGRRARFMPPFRTYLVLSIVFFLVAFFDTQRQFGMLYEPQAASDEAVQQQGKTAAEVRREVLDDLAAEGIYVPGSKRDTARDPQAGTETNTQPEQAQEQAEADDRGIQVRTTGVNANCDLDDFTATGPDWFTRRVTKERLQHICERVVADSGRSFINQLLDNIPAALFVLLPLMAFVLKILYPLSKRYYVEHLLFLLHFHAFFFLILSLQILFSRMARLISFPAVVTDLTVFAVSLYVPVYLYKAMRRVYAQGRAITILKYFVLILTYLIGLMLMLLFAAFYTAFSI
jgi:hypothetical protein